MKILITGVAGFLGYHLAKRLLQYGNHVVGIDDLSTGQHDNLMELEKYKNFYYDILDIGNGFEVGQIRDIYGGDFDVVYNLACPASPPKYQEDPLATIDTNYNGVLNLLERFGQDDNTIFVQASTSEVYGDPLVSPQSEEYKGNVNPLGPRACYDEGKRIAETLIYEHWAQGFLSNPPRIMRIFNTYGPHMDPDDGRVVSNFIKQALNNEDITVYGSGDQTRSFCYVDDQVRAFLRVVDIDANGLLVVNSGNPDTFTINELASLVIDKTDSNSSIVNVDLPVDDPKVRTPNIDKFNRLGWRPEIPLVTGLDLTIDYFRSLGYGTSKSNELH